MKTILVDDEEWGLKRFEIECGSVPGIEIIGKFRNGKDALAFAKENRIDIAFLDIEMPMMNGIELYDRLLELYPDMVAIFVTAHEEFWPEAMSKRDADYFITKPYTREKVVNTIDRAKRLSTRQHKRVEIRTFGNFEVYVDGEPLNFTSPKAKEILALLVDNNGDSMTLESLYSNIWEDTGYNNATASKLRHVMRRLQNTLEEAGIESILKYSLHARAFNCDIVECDYFDFLREDEEAIKKYKGKYMSQYSWAERRINALNRIKSKHFPHDDEELYED